MIRDDENNNSNTQIYSNSFNNINPMNNDFQHEDQNNIELDNEQNIGNNDQGIYEENDNINDDAYMMELQRKLAMMKQERKLAEKDSQLLFNRLRLLKNEEEKTWKKISDTKKKTNEKMNNLVQMQQNYYLKQELNERKKQELQEKKQINFERKFNNRTKLQQKKEEKLRQVNEEFKLLKMQKQYNDELRNYIMEEEKNINKTKCVSIRNQQLVQEEKKKNLDIEKRNKIRMELEKKLLEEYRLKEEAQNKLVEYENEEMEALKRIRTTTQVHKNMCEQLENLKNEFSIRNLNQSQSLNNLNNNNNSKGSFDKSQYSNKNI